jgi:hypothetical protein
MESSDLCLCNQYILVMVISSCFPFCKNVFASDKPPIKVHPKILHSFFLGKLHVVYMEQETSFPSCGAYDVHRHGSIFLFFNLLNQFWTAVRFVCSFCETVAESLSKASIAVSYI